MLAKDDAMSRLSFVRGPIRIGPMSSPPTLAAESRRDDHWMFLRDVLVFQLKMFTILLAGATLLLFYCTSTFRKLGELGPGEDAPPFAKFIAVTSIVLWLAVIVLGRYIPFGEVT